MIDIGNMFLLVLRKFLQTTTVFLTIMLPALVFAQVLLRYVFQIPLMGIEEIMIFPIIWLYFLGGAEASRTRTHIYCGILTLYIKKEKTMALFNVVRSIISLVISLWLTYWSYWFFAYSLRVWKLSDLVRLPMFFAESALFIGLILISLYTAIELIDMVRNLYSMMNKHTEVI
ncbi:MAG: TRAP transporter small permease [Bacillota bacterium]|nr:TRAP transporter small permease [Bacillota bacterium]